MVDEQGVEKGRRRTLGDRLGEFFWGAESEGEGAEGTKRGIGAEEGADIEPLSDYAEEKKEGDSD